jgi:hypothetical protein
MPMPSACRMLFFALCWLLGVIITIIAIAVAVIVVVDLVM